MKNILKLTNTTNKIKILPENLLKIRQKFWVFLGSNVQILYNMNAVAFYVALWLFIKKEHILEKYKDMTFYIYVCDS